MVFAAPVRSASYRAEFDVIAETADYIVVNKPAPLLVHPTKPGPTPTLLDGLKVLLGYEMANGAQLSIINRLDRETSGLVLVAKNVRTARAFHRAMERRLTRKEYQAIIWDWPEEDSFCVDAPMLRRGEVESSPVWLMQCIHSRGAEAYTEFEVVRRFEKSTRNGSRFSVVRAMPHTGRMHQIRLHLRHAGFGVVGDKLYGLDEHLYLKHIETGWTEELAAKLLLPRQALHSCALGLSLSEDPPNRPRPDDYEPIPGPFEWQAPLAADLAEFIT